MVKHYRINLPQYPEGFHLITDAVMSQIGELPENGMFHLFIQHTSAALTINENADPSVRTDLKTFVKSLVPENYPDFTHVFEGSDDMPAHVKASLFGNSITIPIVDGRLALGTWQGIYLCEFRYDGGGRRLVASVVG